MSSIRSGVLVALVVFAGAMVLFTDHATAPFYYHQDEPGKVLQVIHRRKNFHHPLLMLSTAEVARKVILHGGAEDDPQRVVEMARRIMAVFAAASSALLALLATRRLGVLAGLAVGLLTVTNPLHYELAHYFKEDPAFLFGIVSCALAAQLYWTRRSPGSVTVLGVAAGVAAAGKYIGAAFVPVAAALAAGTGERNAARALEARRQGGRVLAPDLADPELPRGPLAAAVLARPQRRDGKGDPRQPRDGERGAARVLLRGPGRLRRRVGSGARDALARLRPLAAAQGRGRGVVPRRRRARRDGGVLLHAEDVDALLPADRRVAVLPRGHGRLPLGRAGRRARTARADPGDRPRLCPVRGRRVGPVG